MISRARRSARGRSEPRCASDKQLQRQLECRARPTTSKAEVERPSPVSVAPKRRACSSFSFIRVDGADLRSAGDARTLDHGEPYRAEADHRDARALPDFAVSSTDMTPVADRAAEQARLLHRQTRAGP